MPSIDVAASQHANRHAAGGPDALSPGDIGAATAGHTHSIAQVSGLQAALDAAGESGGGSASGRIVGTGHPNGVVSAPVGTEYIDTNATTGARRWYKDEGTGNTGWIVDLGYTGEVKPSWLPSNAEARATGEFAWRRGNRVTWTGGMIITSTGTASNTGAIPVGWRPTEAEWRVTAIAQEYASSIQRGSLVVAESGTVMLRNASLASATIYFTVSWETLDPWPTSLSV